MLVLWEEVFKCGIGKWIVSRGARSLDVNRTSRAVTEFKEIYQVL